MGASALALVIWWSVFIVGMGVILILLARQHLESNGND